MAEEEKCTHGSPVLINFSDEFSFTCDRCLQSGNGTCYTCHSQCDHYLHRECHTPTITMLLHEKCRHTSLLLIYYAGDTQFVCDGCLEPGLGAHYSCHSQCNYDLHEECHVRQHYVYHDKFYKGKRFEFEQSAPKDVTFCEVCGRKVNGWRYRTWLYDGTRFDWYQISIHPCCMSYSSSIEIGGVELTLSCKELHKLNLCCGICGEQGSKEDKGWSYVSDSFDTAYHVKCHKMAPYDKDLYEQCYALTALYQNAQALQQQQQNTAQNALEPQLHYQNSTQNTTEPQYQVLQWSGSTSRSSSRNSSSKDSYYSPVNNQQRANQPVATNTTSQKKSHDFKSRRRGATCSCWPWWFVGFIDGHCN